MPSTTCQACAQLFEIDSNDGAFYQNLGVPHPTHCPECRQQRRLAWRNERMLYRRKCSATGQEMLSVYSEDKPFPVYDNDFWYSDKWDAKQYGRDIDFNRPFFDQFRDLMHAVPQLARSCVSNENCDYVNQCGWCKDCYLIFEADHDHGCYYSNNLYDSRDCMDMLHAVENELCYECIDCSNGYNLKFSQDSKSCSDSWFLKNCVGCKNCFGCVNLQNKEYYYLNKPYSPDEYRKKIAALNLSTFSGLKNLRQSFADFCKKFPMKYLHGVQNEDSTGNYLSNTQRCKHCFDVRDSQDCKFVFGSRNTKMVYDMTLFGGKPGVEFSYENHEVGGGCRNLYFCDQVWEGCHDLYYSKLCMNSSKYLFGCVGLKRAEYCILNKSYSKEEYESLKTRLIEHMKKTGEWGEFFPVVLSPYGYNETIAQDYYPLSKEQALTKGYKWKDVDRKDYRPQTAQIPDAIHDVKDTILNELLACAVCNKNYKIIAQELRFYRQHGLPISRKCPDCRHHDRMALRNPRRLYDRVCGHCGTALQTTYSPERPEPVYCEACYWKIMD